MVAKHIYRDLYQAIVTSEYGDVLVKNIRFSRFKPDSIKSSTWERILGSDVNNLRHMWFTKKLTDRFLSFSPKAQFTESDRHYLRLSATFHDLAESIVGDIAKVDKTTDDEQHEKQVLTEIVTKMSLISPIFLFLKSDINYCIEHILFPKKPTRLSITFSIIEYLGYLHTASKARIAVDLRLKSTPLLADLTTLAHEVTDNSLSKLYPHQSKFPGIAKLIFHTSPYLDNLTRIKSRHDHISNLHSTI